MTVTIRQIGPCFAGEVDGVDMRRPLAPDEVAAIHAGMDRYAVLVFREQDIDDAQQLVAEQESRLIVVDQTVTLGEVVRVA